jgi:hypothetical protein
MSKNHSHDNIYSILGKLEALQPTTQEKHDATVQQIRESVESQGSILKGLREVGSVEQRLAKQFAEAKKAETGKSGNRKWRPSDDVRGGFDKDEYFKKNPHSPAAENPYFGKQRAKDEIKEGTCNECGMTEGSCEHTKMEEEKTTHKGGEVTQKDGVTKHRKTDFPGYQSDSDEDKDNDDEPKKAGRPRKHAKKVDTGEKKGRGRPKKEKAPEYDKRHDPFGRVGSGAEKAGKDIKGKKHQMDEKAKSVAQQRFMGMVHAAQKGSKASSPAVAKVAKSMGKKDATDFAATKHKGLPQRVAEGINFAQMLKEKHATVDEMLAELSNDIKLFKETGHCSELLRDCMDLRGYASKQMAEVTQTPPPAKGTDLVTPQQRLNPPQATKPGITGAVKDVAKGLKNFFTGKPDQGPTYEEVTLEDELSELAKLAGLNQEGNAFTGKLKSTPKGGSFELDGKTYKDTSTLDEEPNEGNAFSKAVVDAKKDGIQPGEKISVGGKEYPVKEEKIDVKDAPEAKNKPRPKYASIKTITTQGDDLHRQKSQNPGHAAKGDNPLTNGKDIGVLEAKLSAEYESIKKSANENF